MSWHTRVELRAFYIKNEPFVAERHLYMALDYESGWSKEERTLTEMIDHFKPLAESAVVDFDCDRKGNYFCTSQSLGGMS
ncbi:hypothetical protein ACFQY3_03930 [Paenibacillus farraposensis]